MPNDHGKAPNIIVAEELDPADVAVITDGLRAIMSTKPDTMIFAQWLYSSAIRRPARLLAGSTGAPNSGLSMSLGYFCRSICAVYGSAAEYWRWLRKRAGDAVAPESR